MKSKLHLRNLIYKKKFDIRLNSNILLAREISMVIQHFLYEYINFNIQ